MKTNQYFTEIKHYARKGFPPKLAQHNFFWSKDPSPAFKTSQLCQTWIDQEIVWQLEGLWGLKKRVLSTGMFVIACLLLENPLSVHPPLGDHPPQGRYIMQTGQWEKEPHLDIWPKQGQLEPCLRLDRRTLGGRGTFLSSDCKPRAGLLVTGSSHLSHHIGNETNMLRKAKQAKESPRSSATLLEPWFPCA